MQINLKSTFESFPTLSPIFQQSPFFTPLAEGSLRKYSYNYDEFVSFRLQECVPQIELLCYNNQIQIQLNRKIFQPQQSTKKEVNDQLSKQEEVLKQLSDQQEGEQNVDIQMGQKSSIKDFFKNPLSYNALQHLIQYLISNIYKDEIQLEQDVLEHSLQFRAYSPIISVLIGKFKKSKKTKEEMVKYCMRKVFKYIADKMKKNRTHNRDINSCMKVYFSKSQLNDNFSIPFKKNSSQKTMNGSFLKRVFSSDSFLKDYRQFLDQFQGLMEEDNYKKVKYLTDLIEQNIRKGQISKIQKIKRLPWTQETLDQTLHLSHTLIEYAYKQSPLLYSKNMNQFQ